ncbi:alpha-catulin isoform X1 [Podarcis lilfordi]|uniref:Alpha-catulin isoform X1 n=1 Tax=Podarcis lilfordi TaxID=74358 RepID=A0AA35QQS2_9SAUR|nr:alpha-catulin isoform X1 [Podarcis lilfordi]
MCQCMTELQRELHSAATSVAADVIKYHSDHLVLKALKICGTEGNIEAVAEHSCKLSEQKEQLIEICHLLRHVSGTEPLEITCLHAEDTFHVTGPQFKAGILQKDILRLQEQKNASSLLNSLERITQ